MSNTVSTSYSLSTYPFTFALPRWHNSNCFTFEDKSAESWEALPCSDKIHTKIIHVLAERTASRKRWSIRTSHTYFLYVMDGDSKVTDEGSSVKSFQVNLQLLILVLVVTLATKLLLKASQPFSSWVSWSQYAMVQMKMAFGFNDSCQMLFMFLLMRDYWEWDCS